MIVTDRPRDGQVRRRLIGHRTATGLRLGYDLPRMGRITVNGDGGRPPAAAIAAYRKIPDVLSIDRDEASRPRTSGSR